VCTGHVQKRVGNRLRKLKKNVKGLSGKGKLTESMIDRMQNYYGIAIRGSKGDIVNMKKSITRHGYTALHRRQISGTFIAS